MTETHIYTQKWNHQQFESIQFASVAGCRRWTHLTRSSANQTDDPKRTQIGDGPCGLVEQPVGRLSMAPDTSRVCENPFG